MACVFAFSCKTQLAFGASECWAALCERWAGCLQCVHLWYCPSSTGYTSPLLFVTDPLDQVHKVPATVSWDRMCRNEVCIIEREAPIMGNRYVAKPGGPPGLKEGVLAALVIPCIVAE